MNQPMMDRAMAVQNAATLLSNFCGRQSSGALAPCEHDHTEDGQAFVRTVEQYAFPELLWDLKRDADSNPDVSLDEVLQDKIAELEARALHVEPR